MCPSTRRSFDRVTEAELEAASKRDSERRRMVDSQTGGSGVQGSASRADSPFDAQIERLKALRGSPLDSRLAEIKAGRGTGRDSPQDDSLQVTPPVPTAWIRPDTNPPVPSDLPFLCRLGLCPRAPPLALRSAGSSDATQTGSDEQRTGAPQSSNCGTRAGPIRRRRPPQPQRRSWRRRAPSTEPWNSRTCPRCRSLRGLPRC